MDTRHAFAKSLNQLRVAGDLTQEDFGVVSSRTYVSLLERGLRSPTLEKIEVLAQVLKVHPVSLLALTYLFAEPVDLDTLCKRVKSDLGRVL